MACASLSSDPDKLAKQYLLDLMLFLNLQHFSITFKDSDTIRCVIEYGGHFLKINQR